MNLNFYNSQSRKKVEFKPGNGNHVSLYVCGPTVYDYCHIGHGRCYVFFDVVYRHLRRLNYQVTYVRNITDIDDKIIKRALEEGRDYQQISQTYTQAFHEDLASLGTLPPAAEPRATEHIAGMITMIEKLLKSGHAYESRGDVYFAIDSYAGYLGLSGRDVDELKAGARVELNEAKRQPLDFALWKASKPQEPFWQSPWGKGRPGWHIECSVMSQAHLGDTIDIHGGGRDLIFPHHENERAQSEAATGKPFVRYWLHNGFLNLDKEKMSKSLGNTVTLRALLKAHHPEVLRHALLSTHYRAPIDFSPTLLKDSRAAMERLYLFLAELDAQAVRAAPPEPTWIERYLAAMNDDFNTPQALATLFDLIKEGNRQLSADKNLAQRLGATALNLGESLGLLQVEPNQFLQHAPSQMESPPAEVIEALIAERLKAKKQKDFARADQIRKELDLKGVVLDDKPDGTSKWRLKR